MGIFGSVIEGPEPRGEDRNEGDTGNATLDRRNEGTSCGKHTAWQRRKKEGEREKAGLEQRKRNIFTADGLERATK